MNRQALVRPLPRPVLPRWPAPAARLGRIGLRLIVPAALLLLWQLVTMAGIYSRGQLPSPLDVFAAARQLAESGRLSTNIAISLQRVVWGFGLGSLIALALGLTVGLSRIAEAMLAPTIQAVRAIPSLAWVPLFVLWMGIDERPKIILIAIGAFFPVYTNLVSGIRQIDRKLIEVGHAYGMRGPRLAREVLLPAALPSLLTGMRLGLAQGWLFLVAAELIGAGSGLGYLLIDGQNTGRADTIVLSMVLLALFGKGTDTLLQLAERRLLRWSDTYGARA